MDDGTTVPLFYKQRVPSMLIQNQELSDEFYQLLEDENLEDAAQAKLERKYATELEVIKRDDRLDILARDIVDHFTQRGYLGKGLVVSVDKFTSVRMYNKVQQHWKARRTERQGQINKTQNDLEKARLKRILDYMCRVEMAVVISEEAGETEKFAAQGLDIKPHRDRLNKIDNGQDIEGNFKDPEHPLQLVFVCAMWLTGFDAPSLSTLYLDKPMRGHTLMQTIARANRVSAFQITGHNGKLIEKHNGEIIDYYNVFRNMKTALTEYTRAGQSPGETEGGDRLAAIAAQSDAFKNISRFKDYADQLMAQDEWRKSYNVYSNTVIDLYEACKPEIFSQPQRPMIAIIQYLRGVIDSIIEQTELDEVVRKVAELLDESLIVNNADLFSRQAKEPTGSYSTPEAKFQIIQTGKTWDLSKVDFDKLQAERQQQFRESPHKNIEVAKLRAFIEKKLEQVMQQNVTRIDFAAQAVKLAAKSLLARLVEEQPKVLIQDWWKDGKTKQTVKDTIDHVLDNKLPETYDRRLFTEKSNKIFTLVEEFARNQRKWAA
jgi:type I restriction enzyme, R subunit